MTESNTTTRARHGASPQLPVIAYAVLTIAAAVIPSLIAGHADWTSDAALLDVYQHHPAAARTQALFSIGAAIPLAVFSAIVSDRIRAYGLQVPGRLIALAGGSVAAAMLATAGLASLALVGSESTASLPVLRFGHQLSIALGGTGFAAFIGLLVAGIAVTGLLGGLLQPTLARTGIGIAVIAELALLTVLTDAANVLLPIARFSSLLWLIAAAFTMRPAPPKR